MSTKAALGMALRGVAAGLALLLPGACTSPPITSGLEYSNPYPAPDDDGRRAAATYFVRRAWIQVTRDVARTELPQIEPLSIPRLAARSFAVAWLGHSSLLVRVDGRWILVDPVLSDTAGPLPGVGPARLTPLPFPLDALPRIDVVLVSHDHYDHLDRRTLRQLARQPGGPPRILAGRGLATWIRRNVGIEAEELAWWDERVEHGTSASISLHFTPAQHSSGRYPWGRNRTLWGGWAIVSRGRTFYYSGDTAYVGELFEAVGSRLGAPDLAALPIGAYQPRPLMRFEHMDPREALLAHRHLGARRSFGVHWATFQLGDEEPIAPQRDLAQAARAQDVDNFSTLPIGGILDVGVPVPGSAAAR